MWARPRRASRCKIYFYFFLTLCAYAHKVFFVNYQQARIRAEILKALAHPVRILIVETLLKGDQCVCELNKLANIDQSNISRHLASLKKAGIVIDRRDGMRVFYHLRAPCILNALQCTVEVMKAETKNKKLLLKEGMKK